MPPFDLDRANALAEQEGFGRQQLQSCIYTLSTLHDMMADSFLQPRLLLHRGTGINLFHLEDFRLSLDSDLSYVGGLEEAVMLADIPIIFQKVDAIHAEYGFAPRGKMNPRRIKRIYYNKDTSAAVRKLAVDVDAMSRCPLFPTTTLNSVKLGDWQACNVHVADFHEMAGEKIHALLERQKIRDLYDSVQIFNLPDMDEGKFRLAVLVASATGRIDAREFSADSLVQRQYTDTDQLNGLVRGQLKGSMIRQVQQWQEFCSSMIHLKILPFRPSERKFLDRLYNDGKIEPELVTDNPVWQENIRQHPKLHWRAARARAGQTF